MQGRQVFDRQQVYRGRIVGHDHLDVAVANVTGLQAVLLFFALHADVAQRLEVAITAKRAAQARVMPARAARATAQSTLTLFALNLGNERRAAAHRTLAAPPFV